MSDTSDKHAHAQSVLLTISWHPFFDGEKDKEK